MSLMQQAVKTYDTLEEKYAGVYYENMREPLVPIAHNITKASIEITLNQNGEFIEAKQVGSEEEKTIFPVTEESSGRTSAPCAHPLCEQIGYLLTENEEKYNLYTKLLEEWTESDFTHPMLKPILLYVRGGGIKKDLEHAQIIKIENDSVKDEKAFVRWIVLGIGEESGACWTKKSLQQSYIKFYLEKVNRRDKSICMISGDNIVSTNQHAKGIFSLNGNAKLISSNDTTNYTYRGRFKDESEALTVGYVSSQKAHNALRWIIQNQGVIFAGRTFNCWSPQGVEIPKPTGVLKRRGTIENEHVYTASDYKQQLKDILGCWKSEYPGNEKAVTAIFDAATTGRLALAYYSEMNASDFVERLASWDETCCWINYKYGITAPLLRDIVNYAYGIVRNGTIEADDAIAKQMMLKLVACRIDKKPIPKDTKQALVKKAGNLMLIQDDKASKYLRRNLIFVTCAVIKKYYYDHYKEVWNMALEPEKKDRSYQYGRLLAVLEKEEQDTYPKGEERETNAIRMQSVFVQRPMYASVKLLEQIKRAYFKKMPVSNQAYYEKITGQIMEQLSEFELEMDRPLEDSYLLGYYLQKNEFYKKRNENENKETKIEEE